MLVLNRLALWAVALLGMVSGAGPALAGLGRPSEWQLSFQQSATPVMDNIASGFTTSFCGSSPPSRCSS